MKTDDLIRVMAKDVAIEPHVARTIGLGLVPALILITAGTVAVLGPREDLANAIGDPVSLMRFILSLGLAILGLRAVFALARPDTRAWVALPLVIVLAAAAGMWVWAWGSTPADGRQMAMVGKTMISCLVTIPVLAMLPVAVLLAGLRRGAATRPMLASAMAGLTGGGLAAAVYALHCTEDSPLFYVTWYGLAIVIVTLVSMLAGRSILRW